MLVFGIDFLSFLTLGTLHFTEDGTAVLNGISRNDFLHENGKRTPVLIASTSAPTAAATNSNKEHDSDVELSDGDFELQSTEAFLFFYFCRNLRNFFVGFLGFTFCRL